MKGARFALKDGAPLTELRFGKSREAAVASNGELNAGSTKDLLAQIGKLMASASAGQVVASGNSRQEALAAATARREILVAAQNDPQQWSGIGEALAADIDETASRNGFLRNLVIEEPLSNGGSPKIRARYKNVTAIVASSALEVSPQIVRDKYFYPAEFGITAHLEVENRDLAQATGDILGEKYDEGLEAIMVAEDRMWKRGADETIGAANPLTTIGATLTPAILAQIAVLVSDWNIPAANCLLSNDFWPDISTNTSWLATFDPVTQAEVLLTGKLGMLYGMALRTDGFRPPEQKVLARGELYVVSTPEHHGAITTRGGIVPTPLNGALQGKQTKGWFLEELISFMITNARSVAVARR